MTSKIVVNNIEADAGVSTVTFNSNVVRGGSNLHSTGLALGAGSTVGAVTGVTTYYGDGSQLTGISAGTALSGSTNNTVCTVTGANAIQGEANLTYDGTDLTVTGSNTKIIVDSRGSNGDQAHIQLLAKDGSGNNNFGEIEYDGDGDFSIASRGTGSANNDIVFKTTASNVERLRISSAGYVTNPARPCFDVAKDDGAVSSTNAIVFNVVNVNNGSHYDTSGRIRSGPAPTNLEIPEYTFVDSNTIKIG